MNRRAFLRNAAAGLAGTAWWLRAGLSRAADAPATRPPNIVVIFADDLGYGDLGCYGHPTIRTPNLDRMAAEGMKLTQFYVAASVCTPSRAGLMTGRLPIRTGMCSDRRRVLFPNSGGGLPDTELTVAQLLKSKGYATMCVGKWHLGHLPQFLPTRRGFDHYFGIPYSNDMRPSPLMDDEKTVEEPAKQATLTRRYTERAVAFIKANRDKPYFLYFPHTFPHVPLFASGDFKGKSPRGLYGDVVEELDWSVGQILDTIRHIEETNQGGSNTLVLFTSDNGPWLIMKLHGGSAGLLRGGKGSTWEGGMREPCIAWWPGKIAPGTQRSDLATTLDILPTCAALTGAELPKGRELDGTSLLPILLGTGEGERKTVLFYRGVRLYAIRKGPWKAHFITEAGYRDKPHPQDPPLLFNLDEDPSEQYPLDAAKHKAVLDDLVAEAERHKATVKPVPNQLEIPLNK